MIVLRALGNAEIETAVTTLTPSQEIVFAAALYLVLERGKRVSRARLASLLWPRVAEKAARAPTEADDSAAQEAGSHCAGGSG